MADRVIQILTPLRATDLIPLAEAILLMGMATTDTGMDAQNALWIDMNSQTVARLCNRVFAREEVAETWRDLNDGDRLFLSHWPILTADVESVESPAGSGTLIDPAAWELEEGSGKLTIGAELCGRSRYDHVLGWLCAARRSAYSAQAGDRTAQRAKQAAIDTRVQRGRADDRA